MGRDFVDERGVTAPTLLFVYNADQGLAAALLDSVHKAVSPATYQCSLCAVTYGVVRMRPAWRAYLRRLPYPVRFYHRQDFRSAWPGIDVALPAILIARDGELVPVLGPEALRQCRDVDSLMSALDDALATV